MSDQQQSTTTTFRAAMAARCRAVIEQHSPVTTNRQRSVSEIVAAALVAPIRRPHETIHALGAVFVIGGGIASLVTGGISEAIPTVALIGVVWLAAVLLANDHRPPADYRQSSHATESAENAAHSPPITEED